MAATAAGTTAAKFLRQDSVGMLATKKTSQWVGTGSVETQQGLRAG